MVLWAVWLQDSATDIVREQMANFWASATAAQSLIPAALEMGELSRSLLGRAGAPRLPLGVCGLSASFLRLPETWTVLSSWGDASPVCELQQRQRVLTDWKGRTWLLVEAQGITKQALRSPYTLVDAEQAKGLIHFGYI